MASTPTKRGDRWFVQVRLRGVSKARSFRTKTQAQAWATQLEAEILDGRYKPEEPEHPSHSLRDAFTRYAEEVSPTKRGCRWEVVRLNKLSKSPIADTPLKDLTADHLGKWRDARLKEVSEGSVLREIALLTAVLETARREWGWLEQNPIRDIRKPPRPRHRERLLLPGEEERILEALGYREDYPVVLKKQEVAVAFLLALETALRCSEITNLQWQDVYLSRRYLTVRASKNGDSRDVPLSARAVELLNKLPSQGSGKCFGVSEGVCSSMFYKARHQAEVSGLTFHDSRAEALTRLAKKLDVLELARMVGHRDPRSLMIYYRTSAADLAKKL